MLFQSKNPQYEYLRKRWLGKHQNLSLEMAQKHGDLVRRVGLGSLGGLMLLTTPGMSLTQAHSTQGTQSITSLEDRGKFVANALNKYLPDEVRPLTSSEETQIAQVLNENFNLKTSPSLEGVRLKRSYGLIGGEQHLYRYPGDTLFKHAESASDWAMYGGSGIAPGLGAWGYFAPSEAAFSKEDGEKERWYIAVQTFLAPGFAENVSQYRDFFKYRKMLVVNPKTGQAVVTDIADAGPSEWTGKHLGGSPEVMQFLGLASGPRKGAVLYFFIDDPKNQVPLGPINALNPNQRQIKI